MFTVVGNYASRMVLATLKFYENRFWLKVKHTNMGFLKNCRVDKSKAVSRVIDHAEFEYGHENCLRPQNFLSTTPLEHCEIAAAQPVRLQDIKRSLWFFLELKTKLPVGIFIWSVAWDSSGIELTKSSTYWPSPLRPSDIVDINCLVS